MNDEGAVHIFRRVEGEHGIVINEIIKLLRAQTETGHDLAPIHGLALGGVRSRRIAVGEVAEPGGQLAAVLQDNAPVLAKPGHLHQVPVANTRRRQIRPHEQPVAGRHEHLLGKTDVEAVHAAGIEPVLASFGVVHE